MSKKVGKDERATVPFGFQLQYEYTGHKGSKVGTKCAVHNNDLDRFVSLDDKSIRIWEAPTDKKKMKDINQINFPKNQTNFIQTIIYIPKIKVYVASALDMTLKIYDGKYTELTSVRTGQRAILCLAYNNARDELVTGGVDGGSLWSFESVKNLLHENDYQGHDIRRRLRFQHDGEDANEWINEIEVDEKRQRVFAMWDNSVDIYDINTGERLGRLLNLHNNTVIGCVYYPINMYLITASKDCTIKVTFGASSTSRAALPVHVFMGHTKEVTGLVLHPQTPNLLLSCSLDGSVRVWNIDTLKEVYRHYVSTPILGFQMLQDEHRLACFTLSGSVLVFTLNHTTKNFALCQSPVMLLETYRPAPNQSRPFARIAANPSAMHAVAATGGVMRLTDGANVAEGDDEEELVDCVNVGEGTEHEEAVPYGTEPAIRYRDCPDGSIMSVSIDGSVRLLRRTDGQCMSLLLPNTTSAPVMGVSHSPAQELLFVLLGGTEIAVFCCRSTPCKFLQRWALPHDAPATCMAMCDRMPDVSENDFKQQHGLLDDEEASLRNVRGGSDAPGQVPQVLAVGNTEGTIQFLDTRKSGKVRGTKQAHKAIVRQLLYQSHSGKLISVGSDDEVRSIEVSNLQLRKRVKLPFKPTCLALAPVAPLLFCGYEDGGLDLVDVITGQVLEFDREARDHGDAVTAANFSESLKMIVTCSLDKTVKIWDWNLNLVRALAMTQPLLAIAFRDGDSGSADLVVGEGAHAALLRGQVVLPQQHRIYERKVLLEKKRREIALAAAAAPAPETNAAAAADDTAPSQDAARSLIGECVKDGNFKGKVVAQKQDGGVVSYTVRYDDGDEEEVDEEKLHKMLVNRAVLEVDKQEKGEKKVEEKIEEKKVQSRGVLSEEDSIVSEAVAPVAPVEDPATPLVAPVARAVVEVDFFATKPKVVEQVVEEAPPPFELPPHLLPGPGKWPSGQSVNPRQDRLKVHQMHHILDDKYLPVQLRDDKYPPPSPVVPLTSAAPVVKGDVKVAIGAVLGSAVGDAMHEAMGDALGDILGAAFSEAFGEDGGDGGIDAASTSPPSSSMAEAGVETGVEAQQSSTLPLPGVSLGALIGAPSPPTPSSASVSNKPSAPTSLPKTSQALHTPRERRLVPAGTAATTAAGTNTAAVATAPVPATATATATATTTAIPTATATATAIDGTGPYPAYGGNDHVGPATGLSETAPYPFMGRVVEVDAQQQETDAYDHFDHPPLDGSILMISAAGMVQRAVPLTTHADAIEQSASVKVVTLEVGHNVSPRLAKSDGKHSEHLRKQKLAPKLVPVAPKFLPISSQPLAAFGFAERRQLKLDNATQVYKTGLKLGGVDIAAEDAMKAIPMSSMPPIETSVPLDDVVDALLPAPEMGMMMGGRGDGWNRNMYQAEYNRQTANQVLHCLQLDLTVDL